MISKSQDIIESVSDRWGHETDAALTVRGPLSWFCYTSAKRFFCRLPLQELYPGFFFANPTCFHRNSPEKKTSKSLGKRKSRVPWTCWRVELKNTDWLNTLAFHTSVLWLKTSLQNTEADLWEADGVEALLNLFVVFTVYGRMNTTK